MKAIIMAAGQGTRMKKVHGDIPKGLIPVGNTTILGNMINVCKENAINDIIIVGGYNFDMLKNAFQDKATVIFNKHYKVSDDIVSLWVAQEHMTEGFIYFHGDAVFGKEFITKLINDTRESVMLVEEKKCDEEDSKVIVKQNKVLRVSKKVPVKEAFGEFVGIAKFSGKAVPSFIESLNKVVEEKGMKNYESETIQHMIDKGDTVNYILSEHPWLEIDFPEDLEYLQNNKAQFGL